MNRIFGWLVRIADWLEGKPVAEPEFRLSFSLDGKKALLEVRNHPSEQLVTMWQQWIVRESGVPCTVVVVQ
jgi:hypothetical protein